MWFFLTATALKPMTQYHTSPSIYPLLPTSLALPLSPYPSLPTPLSHTSDRNKANN